MTPPPAAPGGPSRTALLACPVCARPLADLGSRAACEAGHSFDFARSGYLNLSATGAGRRRVGDGKEMIAARAAFLASGHYEPLAGAVARAALPEAGVPATVAEIGTGTGYYLDRARRELEAGRGEACAAVGIDLSVAAATHAARAFSTARFAVADAEERIPLGDATVGALLSVFSPRPAAESGRVAAPGAVLVAAFATERHLAALRGAHGLLSVHPDKLAGLSARLAPWFEFAGEETVEYEVTLSPEEAAAAIAMGPSARHREKATDLPAELDDVVSVAVARFLRRSP